jgi:hypothetical protein
VNTAATDLVTDGPAGTSWPARLTGSRIARAGFWLVGAVLLALGTWHMPGILPPSMLWFAPQNSLDDSWAIALHMAHSQGLDFGRDVVFTYGPLGFLSAPLLVQGGTSSAAYAYAAVIQVALALLVFRSAARSFGIPLGFGLAFLALCLPLVISDMGVYIAFFGCIWLLERDEAPPWWWLSSIAGVLAAVQLLVKLNNGLACLVLFALAVWRLPPGRLRSEGILLGSFAVSLIVLWLGTGNPLDALPDWVQRSREIVSAYTNAMALEDDSRREQYVAALLLLGGAAALLVPRLRFARARTIPLLLAACIYAFAYLKEGFVRHDGHDTAFFCAFAVGILAFRWQGWARWAAAALVLGAVGAVVMGPENSLSKMIQPVTFGKAAVMNARDLVDFDRRDSLIESRKIVGREAFAVPPDQLALLRGHTVDVVPMATAAVWTYGLKWQPEPILQWYMAYDGRLDQFNADAIADHGAERILRSRPWAVDGKEPAFEAPASYLAMLCHYRELAADSSWEVLARTANRCGEPRRLATVEARAGERITIPTAGPGELVYARVHFDRPVLDRLESLVFKPVHLPHVTLDGTQDHRFIPATADGPLVVRTPATAGLSPLFDGVRSYDTMEIRNVLSFTIEFEAVPVQGSPWVAPEPSIEGSLEKTAVVLGKQRYPLAKRAASGYVDSAQRLGPTALITGWAANAATALPAERIVVFAGDELIAETGLTQPRPDVARALDSGAVDFGFGLALSVPPGRRPVRVFALAGGHASELSYPSGYPWAR